MPWAAIGNGGASAGAFPQSCDRDPYQGDMLLKILAIKCKHTILEEGKLANLISLDYYQWNGSLNI